MLTEKDLQHIADLARIKLSNDEAKKFPKELCAILDFIDQLNKADTSQVEPAYQITGLVNSFRTDEYRKDFEMNPVRSREGSQRASASNGMNEDLNEKLIGQAPDSQNRF